MKNFYRSKIFFFVSILAILLTSLACLIGSLNNNDQESVLLQQTVVALQATNAAIQELSIEPTQAIPTTTSISPQINVIPTSTPLMINQSNVAYQGISFSFNKEIITSVNITSIGVHNIEGEEVFFDSYPQNIEFMLIGYPVLNHSYEPKITVYPIGEYHSLSSLTVQEVDHLKQVLGDQNTIGILQHAPFLPVPYAAQMFSTNLSRIDFQNGSGIRYLTMYVQNAYPVDNQNLFYTFQGITDDDQYYISAIFPVTHLDLPFDGGSQINDWMTFYENFQSYLEDTKYWFNNQSPDQFSPNLLKLDEMIASFEIVP
jgi:hypothetical protein